MYQKLKIFIVVPILFFSGGLFADAIYLNNLFYDSPGLTLQERVLGRNCYSLSSSWLGASCSPSALALEHKSSLRFNLVADQFAGTLVESSSRLQTSNPIELIQFLGRNPGVPDTSFFMGSIWYQNEQGWQFSYTPFKGGMISDLRNSALTQITTHIVSESELSIKKGYVLEAYPQWLLGWDLKRRDTKFLRGQFLLIDAISNPDMYLQPQREVSLFLDPSVRYHLDSNSSASFSLQITNLKIHSSVSSPAPRSSIELGYASEMSLNQKILRQSIHFSTRPDLEHWRDRISWGLIYEAFDQGSLTASLAGSNFAFGYLGAVDSVTWGFAFESNRITLSPMQYYQVNRWVGELGLQF